MAWGAAAYVLAALTHSLPGSPLHYLEAHVAKAEPRNALKVRGDNRFRRGPFALKTDGRVRGRIVLHHQPVNNRE